MSELLDNIRAECHTLIDWLDDDSGLTEVWDILRAMYEAQEAPKASASELFGGAEAQSEQLQEGTMFHAKDGWYFDRLPGGLVRIEKRENNAGRKLLESITLLPESWASIVASVSARSETGPTYREALTFHNYDSADNNAFTRANLGMDPIEGDPGYAEWLANKPDDMRNLDIQGKQMRDPDDQMEYLGS